MDPALLLLILDDGDAFDNIFPIVEELVVPLYNNVLEVQHRNKRPRNNNYFEITIPMYNDDLFQEHFHMSQRTFEDLANVIGNVLHNNQNNPVPLRKKLMYTLWTLAKPESFLAVGDRFNLAKSTGHVIFKEIVTVLANLVPQYVVCLMQEIRQYLKMYFVLALMDFPV